MRTLFAAACTLAFASLFFSSTCFAQDAVLSGTVVTPDRVIPYGWVVVKGGHVVEIRETAPAEAAGPLVETSGIIFPGFVDLHDHPMYNIFERWVPRTRFKNRYEWRDLVEYNEMVGRPGGELQKKTDQDHTFCDMDEFVELKALIGGTTSITGISARSNFTEPIPKCVAGLARNLDWASGFDGAEFGQGRVENVLGVTPRDLKAPALQAVMRDLQQGKIDLLLVHVAEGAPGDMESATEFRALKGAGLLGPNTAIIHGVALGADEFQEMAKSGTALIWSPRSNFELYGFTADVAAAVKANVMVALAPDWSPTGSTNSLAELKYAKTVSHEKLSDLFSDEALFRMSTSIAAKIADVDGKVGSLKPGAYADLFVLSGDRTNPFAALTIAKPQDVQLVLVGGVPMYGSETMMRAFQVKTEPVDICGAKMYLNAAALPSGPFSGVVARLTDDLKPYAGNRPFPPQLGKLVECGQ
jgi:cytosine/adenosine deaminase-related metal-dependent hydrolase